MKLFIKENKILLFTVVIALIVAIAVIGGRFYVEHHNNKYDIVVDYNEMAELASQSKHDISWWLGQFKDMNITKIGLAEENLLTLSENKDVKVNAKVMAKVMKEADWQDNYPKQLIDQMYAKGFDKYDVLVEADRPEDFDFIKKALVARYHNDKYYYVPGEKGGYFILNGTAKDTLFKEKYTLINSMKKDFAQVNEIESSKIMYLNLGMLPSKIELLKNAKMDIIPRTASYKGWNDTKYAKAIIAEYKALGIKSPYMIVGGEAVIGYDDGIDVVKKYINDNNITIGLIENTTQLKNTMQFGVEDVVKQSEYKAMRVYSVWDYIQNRYQYYGYKGAKEIENTLFTAVSERNIRVIYFKPIKEYKDQQVYVTNIKEYKTLFENLNKRLAEHNIEYGSASVMANYHVPFSAMILMGLGCLAAGILLLKLILPVRKKYELLLLTIGALGVIGAAFVLPSYMELLCSFTAAVIFPCLAITFITKQSKVCSEKFSKNEKLSKIIPIAVVTLIIGVMISMIGAMLTAAPISTIDHMLELTVFRGVKLAQLLPIAFFVLIYLAYYGFGMEKKNSGRLEYQDIKNILNTNIKIWMIILGGILAVVGWYYMSRTGHDSVIEVSSTEMLFRNALEDHLIARPRNKEFLFAFPALMMFVYSSIRGYRLWPAIFGLASVIGLTSVVNTFMHIRTPLYLGFARTGYSLLFGLIVGVVAIVIFELLYKLYNTILNLK